MFLYKYISLGLKVCTIDSANQIQINLFQSKFLDFLISCFNNNSKNLFVFLKLCSTLWLKCTITVYFSQHLFFCQIFELSAHKKEVGENQKKCIYSNYHLFLMSDWQIHCLGEDIHIVLRRVSVGTKKFEPVF